MADTVKLAPDAAGPYLDELAGLITVARPGALFPPPRPVLDLLRFLARPRPKGGPPPLEVHLASGFPARRALVRLLTHQRVVRDFLAAHRAQATKASSSYHVALAATALPPASALTVRLVGREGRAGRFVLVHDAWAPGGRVVRLTAQLTQSGGRAIALDRKDQATASPELFAALEKAAVAGALAEVLAALEAFGGVTVHEVERGELGPFHAAGLPSSPRASAHGATLRGAVSAGGAVLCLGLERVGRSVRADKSLDPWAPAEPLPPRLATRGLHAFRERRLITTPAVEAAVRALAPGCIVRSR